jgi:sugar phosphate isomerase/epimerase
MTIPVGLQLYAVRESCAQDFAGTLSQVGEMGYAAVEFAGYYGNSAPALRRMLDERGLKCCGTHTQLHTLLGDELPRTIEFNRALGNRFLIVPSLPAERRSSRAAWLDTARVFNDIAARVKEHGLRVGYHNHRHEFQMMDGELPWDIFFGNTDASVVMQLDMGHAVEAGADPAAVLQRYAGRATTVHLAEFSFRNNQALLGEGDVQWREVLDACEHVGGTQWYIVEQETYPYPPLECAARCLTNLRRLIA